MSGGAQGRILAGHQGLGPHAFALEPGRQTKAHYGSARGDTPGKRGMPRIGQMDEIIPET